MNKKKPRCPVCKDPLALNGRYHDGWCECENEACDLFGMEGFPWHWEALTKLLSKPKDAA